VRRWNDDMKTVVCTQGVDDYSEPIGLDDEFHIDLIVVGCVAVSPSGECFCITDQGSHTYWKVMGFLFENFQDMEKHLGLRKSWKSTCEVLEFARQRCGW